MRPLLIGIAGPPCAGKTTLCAALSKRDGEVTHISMESFYKDTEHMPFYRQYRNFDSPKSINFESLSYVLKQIVDGKKVTIPVYSKEEAKCVKEELVKPTKIILVEGFLLFSRKPIRQMFDARIYIDINSGTQAKRKSARNSGNDLNQEYCKKVLIPMAKKYVIPTKRYADYVLDGTHPQDILADEVAAIIAKYQ
jgi:uridine kinase